MFDVEQMEIKFREELYATAERGNSVCQEVVSRFELQRLHVAVNDAEFE